jgi:ABC-type multidrug transport system fused ATPase/permease subunit
LNYHLEQLKGVLEKNASGYYVLTSFGKKAVEHLNLIEQRTNLEDEKYVKIAALSKKGSLQPIVRSFLVIGIVLMAVFTGLWVYIGYIAFSGGAPTVVLVLLPIGFVTGLSVLGVSVYALLKAPAWLRRFEQRFFGEP